MHDLAASASLVEIVHVLGYQCHARCFAGHLGDSAMGSVGPCSQRNASPPFIPAPHHARIALIGLRRGQFFSTKLFPYPRLLVTKGWDAALCRHPGTREDDHMFRQPKPVNQRPGILGHHVSLTQGFLRAYAEVGECSGTKSTLTGKGHVATASMNPLLHSFDVFDRCVTTFEQNLWLGWPACFNLDRHGFDESEQSIRAFCGSARAELGHHGCPNAPVLVSNTVSNTAFW